MPRGQPIILPPVSAGIRQDQVPPLLDPTATLWRSQNVIPRFGEIRLRPGVTTLGSMLGPSIGALDDRRSRNRFGRTRGDRPGSRRRSALHP